MKKSMLKTKMYQVARHAQRDIFSVIIPLAVMPIALSAGTR